MPPSRIQLIQLYWLDGLAISEIAPRFGMTQGELDKHFKRLGVLRRARTNSRRGVNRARLEMMLLPSLAEYERQKNRKLVNE